MNLFRTGMAFLSGALALAFAAACNAAPTQPPAAQATTTTRTPPGWDAVVAEAKKEGTVVWHITSDSEANKAVAAAFEKEYGIKVTRSVIPAPDFLARTQAETGAGKVSTDVSSSGSARQYDEMGLGAPLGDLPVMLEPPETWLADPFKDITEGRSQVPTPNIDPNYMLAHEESCPESNCPRSYKDLADPRYKGMLLLNDPSAASTGSFILGYLYEEYGESYIRDVIANTSALTRNLLDQERQVAHGEYALSVMGKAPEQIWQLPPPRPIRIITPEDGMIPTVGGLNILKSAPHPNAARVFVNFQFTRTGQQARAGVFGGTFVRKDVTAVDPTLISMGDKWFPKWSLGDVQAYTVRYPSYIPIYEKYLKQFGLK